ncbi:phosphoadenosine phosphosulfate reductase family protein [Anaerotignum propionicum]|uniref:Phosphoadenosine phosphosulfate reductase n=1 Tax=Anaerotignum propionicum DSM 1682 TaxID=991789 RepID=A0A0X8VBK5_ANAPI|nr:phosphoadenosine phosphosulfate reductase family protein [Anaerotignum propionicum]AMJ41999.1 phosphoadenosine phosphosulfate reductase [Anaerotignum propionicum DSM 1682]SHF03216.1 Phosphoadenosine phosphosulfate reductase family protein [[Clostridium] propionicum DSM 1682] [Anaerotignum propionicum DSM 1682]
MDEAKRTMQELKQMQSLPMHLKLGMTRQRIREWVDGYGPNGVYISFSGGKDSTVLLHIVREMYPDIEAVFVNTGLEYPEIKEFVKAFDNVTILRPDMSFRQVIEKYGYPVISKEVSKCVYYARRTNDPENVYVKKLCGELEFEGKKSQYNQSKWYFLLDAPFGVSNLCCDVMKKRPLHKFYRKTGKVPITGQMADESKLRTQKWINGGCNLYDSKFPISNPMSLWVENDVLEYIVKNDIQISSVYGEVIPDCEMDGQMWLDGYVPPKYRTTGVSRTGCMFCMFGDHLEQEPNRFQRMKITHPPVYRYCLKSWNEGGLGMKPVLDYVGIKY